jgi:hypothetical protein
VVQNSYRTFANLIDILAKNIGYGFEILHLQNVI